MRGHRGKEGCRREATPCAPAPAHVQRLFGSMARYVRGAGQRSCQLGSKGVHSFLLMCTSALPALQGLQRGQGRTSEFCLCMWLLGEMRWLTMSAALVRLQRARACADGCWCRDFSTTSALPDVRIAHVISACLQGAPPRLPTVVSPPCICTLSVSEGPSHNGLGISHPVTTCRALLHRTDHQTPHKHPVTS